MDKDDIMPFQLLRNRSGSIPMILDDVAYDVGRMRLTRACGVSPGRGQVSIRGGAFEETSHVSIFLWLDVQRFPAYKWGFDSILSPLMLNYFSEKFSQSSSIGSI